MWAEIGDARRFTSSDQLVRFAGLDVTAYSTDGKTLTRAPVAAGLTGLRWAAFEAAKNAARRGSPDYAYYRRLAAKQQEQTTDPPLPGVPNTDKGLRLAR
jgi:transposase